MPSRLTMAQAILRLFRTKHSIPPVGNSLLFRTDAVGHRSSSLVNNDNPDHRDGDDSNPVSEPHSPLSKRNQLINCVRQAESRRKNYRNFLNSCKRSEKALKESKTKSKYDDLPTPLTNWRLIALKVIFTGWVGNGANIKNITSLTPQYSPHEDLIVSLQRALVQTRLIDEVETSSFRLLAVSSSPECVALSNGDVMGESGAILVAEVRTNLSSGIGVRRIDTSRGKAMSKLFSQTKAEIKFTHVINKALPDGVRVTAWAPLPVTSDGVSVYPKSVSFVLPKARVHKSLLTLKADILKELRRSGNDSENEKAVVDVIELTGDESQDSTNSSLDLVKVTISFKDTTDPTTSCTTVKRVLNASISDARSEAFSSASSSSPYLLIRTSVLDQLNWHYDIEALADVSIHFKRLQTELAIKAAVAQQALDRVEKLLLPLEKPAENLISREITTKPLRPHHHPSNEVMTFLPNDYLLKNYDSYIEFLEKNQPVWDKWRMTEKDQGAERS